MGEGLSGEATARRAFHTLDGMRGVAAIAIALLHYQDYCAPVRVGSAYLAVDLFFAMSGFVLAFAYRRRLDTGMSAGRFMLLRLVRLYPLYLLGLLIALIAPVGALILSGAHNWTWGSLAIASLAGLLFLPTPPLPGRPAALYPFNSAAWSLIFELAVNLLFAAMLRLRLGRLAPLLVLVSAPAMIAAALWHGSLDGGWLWPEWWIAVARVIFSFFLGVAAFAAYDGGRLPRLRCPPWALLVAAAFLLWFTPAAGWRAAYDIACVLVLFPLLLWLSVVNEPQYGARAFAVLGLVSYPLYAVHVPFQTLLLGTADRLLHGQALQLAPAIGFLVVAGLVGVSWILAVTFDPVARRWLGRRVGLVVPRVA